MLNVERRRESARYLGVGALVGVLLLGASAASARAAAQTESMPQETAAAPGPVSDTDSSRGYDEARSVWNAHRIVRVLGDGTHVVLGDGTIWEIFLPDRPSVNTWKRGDLLLVRQRSIAQGDFDYSLIDGRTRGDVAARLVGAAPRRG